MIDHMDNVITLRPSVSIGVEAQTGTMDELLNALENMVNTFCPTLSDWDPAAPMVIRSGIPASSEAMLLLARFGRLRIVARDGDCIEGVWIQRRSI